MNKGIIMEIKSDYAIIMNDSGYMEKIVKKKNMDVGKKIFYFDEDIIKSGNIVYLKKYSFMKVMTSIAAVLFIAFTFFYQISYKQEAYAIVSLDVNPSIQIEVDSDKNIIKAEGMNNDGRSLDYSKIEGLSITDGIENIKNQLVEKKYLEKNKDVLVAFALVGKDDDKNYEETIKGAIKSSFKSETVTFVKGKQKDVEEAKTKGISLGRYEVVQMAGNGKEALDTAPVKEITELIKDKENVIQWNDKTVEINAESVDVKVEEPKTEEKGSFNNDSQNGNITHIPTDSQTSGNEIVVEGENVGDTNLSKPKDDVIINVQPDVNEEEQQQPSMDPPVEEPIKDPATSVGGEIVEDDIVEEEVVSEENME